MESEQTFTFGQKFKLNDDENTVVMLCVFDRNAETNKMIMGLMVIEDSIYGTGNRYSKPFEVDQCGKLTRKQIFCNCRMYEHTAIPI